MKVVETVQVIDFNGPLDALRNNKVKAADTAFSSASHVTLAVEKSVLRLTRTSILTIHICVFHP